MNPSERRKSKTTRWAEALLITSGLFIFGPLALMALFSLFAPENAESAGMGFGIIAIVLILAGIGAAIFLPAIIMLYIGGVIDKKNNI